jgi:hypothetical protein
MMETKVKKEKKKVKVKKGDILKVNFDDILKPRTLARFFGIDPNGEDGMEYQKRVRNEWS